MPGAFPFSAPRFTDADEAKEKATLKEDELKRVEADLQGNSGEEWKDLETIDFMVSKLREFQTEVDALPQIQKQAYADAIAKVPQLVEEETNPMAFLRSVRYNAKVSRRRKTNRKCVFSFAGVARFLFFGFVVFFVVVPLRVLKTQTNLSCLVYCIVLLWLLL